MDNENTKKQLSSEKPKSLDEKIALASLKVTQTPPSSGKIDNAVPQKARER